KKSFHLEVPTLSSSSSSSSSASPSPTVQPASVSTVQARTTPTFPNPHRSIWGILQPSVLVIIAREGAEVGDGLLLPTAIRTWLMGSRDRGDAKRRTKTCSEHNLVR
ncbi:hypothetical protein EG68_08662, partial [Paragonimus skrjabini miyazakii]